MLAGLVVSLKAQQPTNERYKTIEDLIEEIASNSDEELDYTSLYDDLNYFLNNPINLNEATEEELEKLQFLNDFQIQSILKYRERFGKFLTIYELQLLHGYSNDDIQRLLPFVTIGKYSEDENFSIKRALKYGSNQLFFRVQQVVEEQEGYSPVSDSALAANPNSRYLGSPQKVYTRYKYQYKNKIYAGFVAEKDAGEAFLRSNINDSIYPLVEDKFSNGFDYSSAHIQINGIGPIKTLALGDYQLQFGQGLTIWSGMSYGKSPYVLNIKKKARKVRSYSSTDENNFLRGVGTTVAFGDFDVSAFYSKRKVDANIESFDDVDEEAQYATSLQLTGLHTTPSKLLDKDAMDVSIFGGNVSYSGKKFKLGYTYAHYIYGEEIQKTQNKYNAFEFSGNENTTQGLNYEFVVKNIQVFGETGRSMNGGLATVNGALFSIAPQVSMAVLHRHYDKDYQSLYAGSFAESKPVNEDGVYVGTIIFPAKNWKISGYYDFYRFLWLRSRVYSPSNGQDYFLQADYTPSRYVSMYVRFKNEIKQQNTDAVDASPVDLQDIGLMKLRYHLAYDVSRTLELKNRIEFTHYQESTNPAELGYMIYQDIMYKPVRIPLSLAFRFAVFDASYNARIYAYENDVLYGFSIPAYNYKGTRTYLTLRYTIRRGIDVWLRYSQFYYPEKDVQGSGLTEIQGKTKSEVKAQVRFKF